MGSLLRMRPTRSAAHSGGSASSKLSWGQLLKSGKNLLKMTGVENWLPSDEHVALTRLVKALLYPKKASSSAPGADYVVFDPKSSSRSGPAPSAPSTFSHAIVFVVGGGNYVEYQNLLEFAKEVSSGPGRALSITYGSTQLVSPGEFVDQLGVLGAQ